MVHAKTLTFEQVLRTKVWGSTVTEWIVESYWRELCRQHDYKEDQPHTATIQVESEQVLINITVA